jgi:type IV pilus assembly protein PilQ
MVIEVKPVKEDPTKLFSSAKVGYKGERLSLNFQNVEVRSLLQVIADFTNLNIITSDSVGGNLTLRLKDVPWDQALDIIMQSKGLDMRKNGNVILIAPKDELNTKEKLDLEAQAAIADLEPLRSESFQLNYTKADSFKDVLTDDGGGTSTKRILSKRGRAVIDARTNQLFVTDIPSKLEELRLLIAKTDIASRQVLIEARIVEANDQFSRNLGAKLGVSTGPQKTMVTGGSVGIGTNGASSSSSTSGQTAITYPVNGQAGELTGNQNALSLPAGGIGGFDPAALAVTLFNSSFSRFLTLELSALEADGQGKIVSSPRVVTADQVKALIEQGTELPYQVATSSGATSIQFRKANLKLEVTPQITPEGNIILDVDVTKDSVGQVTTAGFAIDTKHVQTKVLVDNGGTVVLGGIFIATENNTITKVPLLGDVPVLGNLFKNTAKSTTKTELLIFITPKVISDRVNVK